jgi:hypothetical protein
MIASSAWNVPESSKNIERTFDRLVLNRLLAYDLVNKTFKRYWCFKVDRYLHGLLVLQNVLGGFGIKLVTFEITMK